MLRWSLVTLLCLCAFSASAEESPRDRYVQQLVQRAHELKLADTKAWLKLLHYRPGGLGGWKSDADGPNFFLAKDGRRNPSAELDATLAGIFWEKAPEGVEHPQCQ